MIPNFISNVWIMQSISTVEAIAVDCVNVVVFCPQCGTLHWHDSKGCFRRSKFDPPRRSDFDPLFKLTNHLVNKVHVSLPSPKTLSIHVQDHCVVGNPI